MFLYMGSFMLSSVVEQAFFVHKACTVDLGFSPNICNSISSKENEVYNKQVQVRLLNNRAVFQGIYPVCTFEHDINIHLIGIHYKYLSSRTVGKFSLLYTLLNASLI